MSVPTLTLNDGVQIPQLGFGTYQIEADQAQSVVETALATGYRHIDTAAIYGNEAEVGAALAASGIDRDELFVTTKLWNSEQGYDSTLAAFDVSMKRLGLDVLDLYLIHWPVPAQGLFSETWKAFETLKADGRVRSIGVSNFRDDDLAVLADQGLTTPSVNQIELHPYLTQDPLKSACLDHGIAVEAWSPLGQATVLDDPTVTAIAQSHDADPGQVVLAWHLAQGNIVFPKSTTAARIESNFAATQISLSESEIAQISGLNRNERIGPDPATFG